MEMTEERIKELANKKLQELNISGKYMQPDDWGELRVWTEDLIRTIAIEVWNGAIIEMGDVMKIAFPRLCDLWIDEEVERLKK